MTDSSSVQVEQTSQLSSTDAVFYINPAENIGIPLVTQPLEGPENFVTWKKSMMRALAFKKKLGFINGKIPKPEDPEALDKWEQCNSAVLSWITNSVSKDITGVLIHFNDANQAWNDLEARYGGSNGPTLFALQVEIQKLKQGDLTVANYYNKLVKLWAEEDAMTNQELCDLWSECKSTRWIQSKRELDKTMKFSLPGKGTNPSY